jgi:hypothetical protein
VERLAGATHLRHRDVDKAFGGAQPAAFVAVARTDLVTLAALVTTPAAQEIGLARPR